MMRLVRWHRRGLAGLLLVAWVLLGAGSVATPVAAAPAAATQPGATPPPEREGLASIRGILYKPDETSRLKGATVTAINTRTGRRYVSNFTGENGAYEVTDLPAGTYDIAIDAADRIYVTDGLVELAEKQRLYLSFSLQPKGATTPGGETDKGQAKMTFTDPNAVPPTKEPQKPKGFWHSAGGIAIITVLVAGAVGAGVAAQRN